MNYGNKKLFLIILLANFTLAAKAICSSENMQDRAKAFVQGLGDKAINILDRHQENQISKKEKNQELRQMIIESVDFKRIGLSALGKYRRRPEVKKHVKTYLEAFEEAVTRTYLNKFGQYNDDDFVVLRVSETSIGNSEGFIVQSELRRKNGPSVSLVWILMKRENVLIIVDLKVEGASMLRTYQQEYQGIIGRESNVEAGIKKLIANLQSNNTKWNNR